MSNVQQEYRPRFVVSVIRAWLALAAGGVALSFAGMTLAVRNDAEFPLPVVVALSLAAAGVLAAFAVTLAVNAGSARDVIVPGVLLVAMCTGLAGAAAASTTYLTVHDISPRDLTAASADHGHGADPGGDAHDNGVHPTFSEFRTLTTPDLVRLSPPGTLQPDDVPVLRDELDTLYTFTRSVSTVEAARTAGYDPSSVDVDAMGAHYLNVDYLSDGVFDPARPEGLLFSVLEGGAPVLVGVWFLQLPGSDRATLTAPPSGFAGELDMWHGHEGICFVGLEAVAEGVTEGACSARNGLYIGDQRWMMHVWIAPEVTENPDGVFAYLNRDLEARQAESVALEQGETE